LQTTGLAPLQTPDSHVSVCVQASPSSQPAPLDLMGFEQDPDDGSQTPATWHWSVAVHTTGFAPMQMPAWHVSVCVHASPSLQPEPLALFGSEHAPVDGSHVPATWHWSLAAHTTGFAPVQTPAWQVSA